MAINPAIDASCSNLLPGLYYCVYPTVSWNATSNGTATSSYVTPPAPTPTGTTADCYTWHTIISGDSCSLLQAEYGITFTQLRSWNPQLDENCSNLLIDAANMTSTTTTKTGTTTTTAAKPTQTSVSPPGPTQSGIPTNCNSWVMQKNVYCYDMAINAGITINKLYELNPALNGDCSGLWSGYAYCIGVSG